MRSKTLEWPFIVLIAVLAPFLCGSTVPWAQGIVLTLLGLLLVIRPPRYSLGLGMNLLFGGFLVLALAAFLPAHWFGLPAWRSHGAPTWDLALPFTVTPQPWLTAEAVVLLIGGLAWLYLLLESQASASDAAPVLKAFCIGITIFAAVSEYLFYTGIRWPFVDSLAHFGPFPNKNQTGHVFAAGSLVAIACIYDAIRERSKGWVWWVICTGVLLNALVLSLSRGAIGVFCIGLIFWLGCICVLTRSRTWTVLGFATVLILLTAFVSFGGKMLDRFQASTGEVVEIPLDLRWTIQKDALTMAGESALTGNGLGNFHEVFQQFHRALGTRDMNFVHPESDWFWLLDEMGWIGIALLLCGIVLFFKRALPFAHETENWHWHAVGCAAALMLLLHGFIDVAGHRMGSVFVALFVASFAMRHDAPVKRSRPIRWVFRLCGVLLIGVGAAWVWATQTRTLLPGTIGVRAVKESAPRFNETEKYKEAIDLTTKAIRWSPIDWELYYNRAVALAYLDEPQIEAAKADFARARFLQPTTPILPLNEGIVWLPVKPELTLPAWKEAIRRAPESRERIFAQMLPYATTYPEALDALRQLAADDLSLRLAFLSRAPQKQAAEGIQELLATDPELRALSPMQKKQFLMIWAKSGDKSALLEQVPKHEEWLPIAWPIFVDLQLSRNNHQRAYEIAHCFAKLPAVPQLPAEGGSSASDLNRRVYANAEDFAAALGLCLQYQKSGATDDALVVLQKVTALKNCPAYFHRLKAEALASRNDWPQALEALRKSLPGNSLAQE